MRQTRIGICISVSINRTIQIIGEAMWLKQLVQYTQVLLHKKRKNYAMKSGWNSTEYNYSPLNPMVCLRPTFAMVWEWQITYSFLALISDWTERVHI